VEKVLGLSRAVVADRERDGVQWLGEYKSDARRLGI
jgi:hypothetical protein